MLKRNILFIIILAFSIQCESQNTFQNTSSIEKVIIDETDDIYGYYLLQKPMNNKVSGALVLFPGLGQKAENIFIDSELHQEAFKNGIMVIGISTHFQIAPDREFIDKIDLLLKDVIRKHQINEDQFVLGGFSAGGRIVMRYAELCKEFPKKHAIIPKGVFAVDSPIDIFHSWNTTKKLRENSKSKVTIDEANWVEKLFIEKYGFTPSQNVELFKDLTPFCMDTTIADHEKYLKEIPVRVYHEVNVPWRLNERGQSVKDCNYIVTSEFIKRLGLLGNVDAEFIQSSKEGWRKNGKRHPHSWSIVDEKECISWTQKCLGFIEQSSAKEILNINPIIIDKTLYAGNQLSPGRNPSQPERKLFFKSIFSGEDLNVQIVASENAYADIDSLEIDEFLFTINGGAKLSSEEGDEQKFFSNEFFVVPKGFSGKWETVGAPELHLELTVTTTKRLTDKNKAKNIKKPVLMDKEIISGIKIPHNQTKTELFDGQEINVQLYMESPSYTVIEQKSHDEVYFLLSGNIIVKNALNEEFSINTGEAFVLPKYFNGSLTSKGPQAVRTLRLSAVNN